MFGYTAEEVIGKPKTILFPPDRVSEEDAILARLRRGERIHHFESIRRRKDGTDIDVSLSISPVKHHGHIVGASTIARDITLSKQHQREVAALNDHLKRAMMETDHRVKNNLQIIAAMIDMQAWEHQGAQTIPLSEFERLKSHVSTLAIAHDLLTKGMKVTEGSHGLSTREVLDKLTPMLQQSAFNHTLRFDIADVEISAKQCTSLALIVNELVSNGLKHGNSEVTVSFRVDDDCAVLEVVDDGPGFPADFNPRTAANTGLELVESLVRTDLAGQSQYRTLPAGGGCVRVSFNLSGIASG
jgi:PAS domain S-box-containing protein